MKKILALVLTLVMILTAVSAMAGDSKKTQDMTYGTINTGNAAVPVGVAKVTPTKALQEIMDQVKAAGGRKGLPADVDAKIPAERTNINEMGTFALTGDVDKVSEAELIFTFATKYPEGEEVTVLIIVDMGDKGVEWLELTGKANSNGDVVVKLTSDQLAKISNNPFLVLPVSK